MSPQPSSVAACEAETAAVHIAAAAETAAQPVTTTPPDALLATAAMLAEGGMFGFVWADQALVIVERYGRIVDGVALGRPLGLAIMPLCGYDDDIRALRQSAGQSLQLTNLATNDGGGPTGRFNLIVQWMEARRLYLVLVGRALTRSEDEGELHRQVRLRQMAEEKLAEQSLATERANAELTRANKELDQFAYVLSHDLKAPLRAMRLLARDLDAALDAGDRAHVRGIAEGIGAQSRRMAGMMSGLYEYARVGRDIHAEEEVDTRALIETIVATLPVPTGFRIEIAGDWPRLRTFAAPLDLVLRNLIDNALKHHDRDRGVVRVTGDDQGRAVRFEVADDGPGIPVDSHAAVFEPFVQLADAPPAESSGIGLSLVRKAAEAVGGAVVLAVALAEAVASPDGGGARGATFVVTWPRRE